LTVAADAPTLCVRARHGRASISGASGLSFDTGETIRQTPMPFLRFAASLLVPAALVLAAAPSGAQTLRGSPASVDRMYQQARSHDLTFYRTATGVRGAARDGDLVRMTGNADYRLAGVSHPYALSITRTFVQRLARQYRQTCREQLVITSAMRPTSLRLVNSVDRSVHPTGMAIDIRRPNNARCLAFLRETLLSLERAGVIEATEERRPPHFHVAVYPGPYRRHIGDAEEAPAEQRSASRSSAPRRDTYRVRQGDSLWEIARRHNTTVDRLRVANDMRTNRIVAGQVLIIPAR
jgi:LysM repeat protein